MKRLMVWLCVLALMVGASGCWIQPRQDKVLHSLGSYESKQLWTHGEFQDYTDFGKYSFSSAKLEGNKYFARVEAADIQIICGFIDNYENWIETFRKNDPAHGLVVNYDFDCTLIDTADYFYIYEGENYPKYGSYDVWFFDTQSNVLYYFHNNI